MHPLVMTSTGPVAPPSMNTVAPVPAGCGPCKMMAPELDKMAAANDPAKVLFAKINCGADDTSKRLAMAQEIRALPTFKLFKAGQVRETIQPGWTPGHGCEGMA